MSEDFRVPLRDVPAGTRVGLHDGSTDMVRWRMGDTVYLANRGYTTPAETVVPLLGLLESGEHSGYRPLWAGRIDGLRASSRVWAIDTDLVAKIRGKNEKPGRWSVCAPAAGVYAVVDSVSSTTYDCTHPATAEALAAHLNETGWEPPKPRPTAHEVLIDWHNGKSGYAMEPIRTLAKHGYKIADKS